MHLGNRCNHRSVMVFIVTVYSAQSAARARLPLCIYIYIKLFTMSYKLQDSLMDETLNIRRHISMHRFEQLCGL